MADDDFKITPADPVEPDGSPFDEPPAGQKKTAGKAIAALVCGILSLIVAGVILGAVAVVLGVLARKEIAGDPQQSGAGMALAGIITGAIGFVLAIILLAAGGPERVRQLGVELELVLAEQHDDGLARRARRARAGTPGRSSRSPPRRRSRRAAARRARARRGRASRGRRARPRRAPVVGVDLERRQEAHQRQLGQRDARAGVVGQLALAVGLVHDDRAEAARTRSRPAACSPARC